MTRNLAALDRLWCEYLRCTDRMVNEPQHFVKLVRRRGMREAYDQYCTLVEKSMDPVYAQRPEVEKAQYRKLIKKKAK